MRLMVARFSQILEHMAKGQRSFESRLHSTRSWNLFWGLGGENCPNDWISDHLDDSNDVGVDDLLIVVAAWGPCQGECLVVPTMMVLSVPMTFWPCSPLGARVSDSRCSDFKPRHQ